MRLDQAGPACSCMCVMLWYVAAAVPGLSAFKPSSCMRPTCLAFLFCVYLTLSRVLATFENGYSLVTGIPPVLVPGVAAFFSSLCVVHLVQSRKSRELPWAYTLDPIFFNNPPPHPPPTPLLFFAFLFPFFPVLSSYASLACMHCRRAEGFSGSVFATLLGRPLSFITNR